MQKFDFKNYDFKRSLILCGPTWVGKTMTATALINKYKKQSKSEKSSEKFVAYNISDAYFKQMVKSNMLYLRPPIEWQSSLDQYPLEIMLHTELLLYDDLWVSDISDAYLRDFTFVLDERIKKGLPTIFTTNLNKDELQKKLNERIVSRVLFNTDVVVFKWEDKRLATTKYFEA